LELAETSDRRTVPLHQVEGGNEGLPGPSMTMVGGPPTPPPTPPPSDDGSSNRSAEQFGEATISCIPISGQDGLWMKEIVVSSHPRDLTGNERRLDKIPFWT
jgi:hypothetical protein